MKPWEMTIEEWAGEISKLPTANRWMPMGDYAHRLRMEEGKGRAEHFCTLNSLRRWVITRYRRMIREAVKSGLPVPTGIKFQLAYLIPKNKDI